MLRSLARPVSAADRRRERLVAIALAGCGVFLLAAFAIATIRDIQLPFDPVRDVGGCGPVILAEGTGLAPYLTRARTAAGHQLRCRVARRTVRAARGTGAEDRDGGA